MSNDVFRKKSVERVSSPEQLNDYIRVSNPGVWAVLIAIILLLAGVVVWGIFGHLDTKITAAGIAENNVLTCYIKEDDVVKIKSGMKMTINGAEYQITEIAENPTAVSANFNSYALHIGELMVGEWVYEAKAAAEIPAEIPDGIYKTEIIVESISPIDFITN